MVGAQQSISKRYQIALEGDHKDILRFCISIIKGGLFWYTILYVLLKLTIG